MATKKIISKGYILEVVSWENDGDYYRTKTITVKKKEKALALYTLCTTLFNNNSSYGIGNNCEISSKDKERIKNFFSKNKQLFPKLDIEDTEQLIDYCMDKAYDLMGSSEYYSIRVCESCTVFYSPEDIYLEEIIF